MTGMSLQGWADSAGKAWGDGKEIAKRAETIKADMKRLSTAMAKMDKATLEKLLKVKRKELEVVTKQNAAIGKARTAWHKYADAAIAKQKAAAQKEAAALVKRLMAPVESAYKVSGTASTDCSAASNNLKYNQEKLVKLIEDELKKK